MRRDNDRDDDSDEDTDRRDSGSWIQSATERMKRRGTLGKFGAATRKKIARAKRKGGIQKKRAVFAENMRKLAARRKRRNRK